MKFLLILWAVATPTIAAAQAAPPLVEDRPLVLVKPRGSNPPLSVLERLRVCLDIDDQTKERLDCYDGIVPPQPRPAPPPAKVVTDCKYLKEEDARLNCFNSFLNRTAKRQAPAAKPVVVPQPAPTYLSHVSTKPHYIRSGRGGCGSRGGAGYRLANGKCASRSR